MATRKNAAKNQRRTATGPTPEPTAPHAKFVWKPGNAVYPSPAVLVSCGRPGEAPNLITIAWCGNVNSDPPLLSISVRPQRHSYGIIEDTREFVVNIPSVDQAWAVDYAGVVSGATIDKFAATGLTAAPAREVACPLVMECPINIECRVRERLPLGTHVMYVAEAVAVSASVDLLDPKGKFRVERANLLFYAHGSYFSLGREQGKFGWSVAKKTAPANKRQHR